MEVKHKILIASFLVLVSCILTYFLYIRPEIQKNKTDTENLKKLKDTEIVLLILSAVAICVIGFILIHETDSLTQTPES